MLFVSVVCVLYFYRPVVWSELAPRRAGPAVAGTSRPRCPSPSSPPNDTILLPVVPCHRPCRGLQVYGQFYWNSGLLWNSGCPMNCFVKDLSWACAHVSVKMPPGEPGGLSGAGVQGLPPFGEGGRGQNGAGPFVCRG